MPWRAMHPLSAENETLFQLIGTTYGGDGQETFALPDLRGRVPIHVGSAQIGEKSGVEEVTLTVNQLPVHTHTATATNQFAQASTPTGGVLGRSSAADPYNTDTSAGLTMMPATTISPIGGSQPHTNFQPYLCVDFIISLFGTFPSAT